MKWIDNILNRITMYKLVLYELIALLSIAGVAGGMGFLAFDPIHLLFSVVFIFVVCWLVNRLFAFMFDAPYNPDSTYITALILALIISPPAQNIFDTHFLTLAIWGSAWAVASKYIFAIDRQHVFNPAALGVAMADIFLGLSASWWIGTLVMTPFVLLGGLLVVRKLHRFDLWWAFIATYTLGISYSYFAVGGDVTHLLSHAFIYAPAIFLSTVMLTEPATMPGTRYMRVIYGALIATCFLPSFNLFGYYVTPEIAILIGNIFTFAVSRRKKFLLKLLEKKQLSRDVYEFVFESDKKLVFEAGQYLEWTLPHNKNDSRGIRRYFTIASAPEDNYVRLGVKFYTPSSTFKHSLLSMREGDTIVGGALGGDFLLPAKIDEKLAFVAGGIGVTPFRSIVQSLLDKKERRDISMLYVNKLPEDAVYRETFEKAREVFGMQTTYAFSDAEVLPPGGVRGIDAQVIASSVPDFLDRTFYISGPQGMVAAFTDILTRMGVSRRRIRTDYFPGFA